MPIRVELQLDNGNFTTEVVRAGDSLAELSRRAGRAVVGVQELETASKSLTSSLRDVSVIFGAASFALSKLHDVANGMVGDLIRTNAEMERLTIMMKNMSTASDPVKDAGDNVKYLRDMAKEVPFSLKEITASFAQMKTAGLDPMGGMFKNLADGVAAMGGTDQTLQRASLAITQMAGKSVIQMEELRRQLGEAVPNAVQIMARAMGTSVAGLNQAVGTGALDARKALELFSKELERSYGGASQQMMNTFSGQVSKLATNWANLQIAVGQKGFFDTIKKQLVDLNGFMESDAASSMAGIVGGGLNQATVYVRQFIETIIGLRHEIIFVGEALAAAFIARGAVTAISSMVGFFRNLSEQVSLFNVKLAATREQMAINQIAMAGLINTGSAGVFERLSFGAGQLGASLGMVARGFAGVAPYLPLLAGGVAILIEYFDLLGSKAKGSYDELKNFGAVSRDQIDNAKKYLQSLKDERQALLDDKENTPSYETLQLMGRGDTDARISALDAKIIIAEQVIAKGEAQQESSEAKRKSHSDLSFVDDAVAKIRQKYDVEATEAEKKENEARAKAIENHESTKLVDDQYGLERLDAAKKLQADLLGVFETAINKQKDLLANGDEATKRAAQESLNTLSKKAHETQTEINRLDKERTLAVPVVNKPLNETAAFTKGEAALVKLNSEVVGLQAGLKGANVEVAELNNLLNEGHKYGYNQVQAVKELIEKLTAAKQLQQDLNELVNGQKTIETDLDKMKAKFRADIAEARAGGNLSDVDKYLIKLDSGVIPGYGASRNDRQKKIMEDLKGDLNNLNTISTTVGDTWLSKTFGSQAQNAAATMLQTIQSIAFAMGSINTDASGANLAGAFAGVKPGGAGIGVRSEFGSERELGIRTAIGEALSESDKGIAAVISVIKNRYGSGKFGDSITDVITAPKQFSVWNEGNPAGAMARGIKIGSPEWNRVAAIYDGVMSGAIPDSTGGSVNYANIRNVDRWQPWMGGLDTKIGAHSFGNHVGTYQGPVYANDSKLPTPGDFPPRLTDSLDETRSLESLSHAEQEALKIKQLVAKTINEVEAMQATINDNGKFHARGVKDIKEGVITGDHLPGNPSDPKWKDYLDQLAAKDKKEEEVEEHNRAREKARSAREKITQQEQDDSDKAFINGLRLKDVNGTKYSDAEIQRMLQRKHEKEAIEGFHGSTEEQKLEGCDAIRYEPSIPSDKNISKKKPSSMVKKTSCLSSP
jgi:tape measure domain-containing protein